MKLNTAQWLENRFCSPAYSSILLFVLAVCFFGAATNTLAGWLYVLSSLIIALLGIGAILPRRYLRRLTLHRTRLTPVNAGDWLTVEIEVENKTNKAVSLLEIYDILPKRLSEKPVNRSIDVVAAKEKSIWCYNVLAVKRGVYHWQEIKLRTASPWGLFWAAQSQEVPAMAVIYPQVLQISQCPIVDSLGIEENKQLQSDKYYKAATEGVTKTLRPYRYGDPIRLIHWRSSAKFEEFKVRELEVITGGEEVIIALDTLGKWTEEAFEKAVIIAATLYIYASRRQLNVKLWLPKEGLIEGSRLVMETLAAVEMLEEKANSNKPESSAVIWLTQNPLSLDQLLEGSRWLYFPYGEQRSVKTQRKGLVIDWSEPLEKQLQSPPLITI